MAVWGERSLLLLQSADIVLAQTYAASTCSYCVDNSKLNHEKAAQISVEIKSINKLLKGIADSLGWNKSSVTMTST